MENHGWTCCKDKLPKPGQIVYYFGPYIGIGIGRFDQTVNTKGWTIDNETGEEILVDLPESVTNTLNHNKFINNRFGVVDTDDAPFWQDYNEDRAAGWCPIPPDYKNIEERLEQDA